MMVPAVPFCAWIAAVLSTTPAPKTSTCAHLMNTSVAHGDQGGRFELIASMDVAAGVAGAIAQEFEEVRLVLVMGEDRLKVIAPLSHLLRIAGQNLAGQLGYGATSH